MMNRTPFGKKTLNTQQARVDRFVLPRDSIANLRRRQSLLIYETNTNDIWYAKYLQRTKYTSYLDQMLSSELKKPTKRREDQVRPWPCIPRKKSSLSSADSILDLPTYSDADFPELLDWSNDNILVAALERNYHKWSWRSQSLVSKGFTMFDIQCCKFDPKGQMLLLGTSHRTIELHNNALSKCEISNQCRCLDEEYCSVTAVDWSPTANSFVTGCSRGVMVAFTRQTVVISWRRVTRDPLYMVRVSPDARFVAASGYNCSEVLLMTWPSLVSYSMIDSDWTVKSMAWHPWRSAFLGIGGVSQEFHAIIGLWDGPSAKIQDTCQLSNTQYCLDAMLFSNITGELVISLWNLERLVLPMNCAQLVVMSDPRTVVDQWGEGRSGLDRVRTMLFSPDGTKLATATADEDLVIWNFLPEDKKRVKPQFPRFSAMPVYLDEANYGISIR